MKKCYYLLIGVVALTLASCGGQKQVAQKVMQSDEVDVVTHCSGPEFFSDEKAFRANAVGLSVDQSTAKKKVLSDARGELATQVEATVKRVIDDYTSSYQSGLDEEAKRRYQDMVRTVVNQVLAGSRVICEKTTKSISDGKYRSYIAVEMKADAVVEALNKKISTDDKLRTDYEYEKFKQVFNEAMQDNASSQAAN
ncbi:MAG: hypothetical protein LBM07_08645 [Culturomica sp.]|jgi:hypothetical protein|nr:hypothetical protein [Culturomica sp.]